MKKYYQVLVNFVNGTNKTLLCTYKRSDAETFLKNCVDKFRKLKKQNKIHDFIKMLPLTLPSLFHFGLPGQWSEGFTMEVPLDKILCYEMIELDDWTEQ